MVDRAFEFDADKDGKLSAAEVANVDDERMRTRLADADTNKDGVIERTELLPVMAAALKRMQEMMKNQGAMTGGGQ
jgi:Ca2+-binding EF-hand superfamily protein